MHTYARIDTGIVAEIIQPATWPATGGEIPIAERFTEELVATMVDVTNVSPQPVCGWSATETGGSWTFTAPAQA